MGLTNCPHCQAEKFRKKTRFWRKIRHESVGYRAVYFEVLSHKYHCQVCKRYFNQRFSGVLPHQRSTYGFKKEVFQKHHDGITQKRLSDRLKMSPSTIERWYREFVTRKVQEYKDAHSPRVLGIDEHFFTKKKGYATTLCDLSKMKVFDITLGRTEHSLMPYLKALKKKGNTKVVVMDLSDTYRKIAKRFFKNAKIVADRFHVIRLIIYRFLKQWHEIDPSVKYNRGLLSLMRRHRKNLRPDQEENLNRYFKEQPVVKVLYDFKQELCDLMNQKAQTQVQCTKLIPIFLKKINQLLHSGFDHMSSLGRTLDKWKDEIGCMWRFTKTNSITEGFHNKMEEISRRAYGFRNFENYKLRVKAACTWK